jgi:hypothetical protein
MKNLESYYTKKNGIYLIEMNPANLNQLFVSYDPSPLSRKDLEAKAEKYITDSVQDLGTRARIRLVFYFPEKIPVKSHPGIQQSIHNYFEYGTDLARRELRLMLRDARLSLMIGILFLFFCLTVRETIGESNTGRLAQVLREGLLISGWVAMWRPIQLVLYDWWPARRKFLIYRKIAQSEISIIKRSGRKRKG